MPSPSPTRLVATLVLAALVGACAPAPAPSAIAAAPASAVPDETGPAAASPSDSASAGPAATSTGIPAPPTEAPATPGALLEVLTLVGATTDTIAFTDWTALKRSAGSDAVTGESTLEAKSAGLRTEYAASGAWLSSLRTHRADWGFDAFDLAWEAAGTSPDGVLHILRFADAAVPGAVLARLDALGYAAEPLPRGTLRTGSIAGLVGKVTPDPALGAAALLDDGRTIVASANPELVRAALVNGPVTPDSDALVAAASLLGSPTSAMLLAGDPCTAITTAVLATSHEGDGPGAAEQLATAGTLGHPEVVAVEYGTGATVAGRVVLTYADPAVAKADLEPRGILARAGSGIGRPLAEVQTVVDARLEGSSIVFDLEPPAGEDATKGFARRLMTAVTRRDMIYAACTP